MSFPSFTHDPQAVLDYKIDWEPWLEGDTIQSVLWTLDPGISQVVSSNTSSDAIIILRGGEDGTNYTVGCRITTVGGRVDERSFVLKVRDR